VLTCLLPFLQSQGVLQSVSQTLEWSLKVEGPAFYQHGRYDLSTSGVGATTLTRSLSEWIPFDQFRPGIRPKALFLEAGV
jgi:hypothetical protein